MSDCRFYEIDPSWTDPSWYGQPISDIYRWNLAFAIVSCYVSAFTWVLFDYSLTLHDEVKYIWKRPLRAGTFLFYSLRFMGVASLAIGMGIYMWPEHAAVVDLWEELPPGAPLCPLTPYDIAEEIIGANSRPVETIYKGVPSMQFLIFWTVEVLLQARIFAIYNSRKLATFNAIFFILDIAVMIFFWCFPGAIYGQVYVKYPAPKDPIAALVGYALYWVPGIAFELWLAALAIAKLRRKILKHDLLTVMVHDSIKYFLLVALTMVIHIVMAEVLGVGDYAVPFVIAGQTIGGSRMILHLRRAYFKSHDHDTGLSRANLSFALATDKPAPQRRLVDETFYVDEPIGDYFDNEEDGIDRDEDRGEPTHAVP